MDPEGTPEPIDFDFFAEDDEDVKADRYSGRRQSPLTTGKLKKARPESAGSVRSAVSSRSSSISVKIPSAAEPTNNNRDISYTKERLYLDSSDDEYTVKGSGHPVQTNLISSSSSSRNLGKNDGRSSFEGDFRSSTSTNRPKTSKGPRAHYRRQDSSSSHGSSSSTSKSNRSHTSSSSSKSEHSDSYTSDSDSDVTDVSPLPSPARSPTPRLEYNQDEFEDSFEENRMRLAKAESKTNSGDGRHNKTRPGKKESVRFVGVTPSNGSVSKRDKKMDETEARELSRLLRAVLEMDDTPNHSQLHSFNRAATAKQRPASAKKAPSFNVTHPLPHQRVNLSFSNDKVKQIDRENQRLLQKILQRPKSGRPIVSTFGAESPSKRTDPPNTASHSAICRQREQRKIEMENSKILERINATRPSSTIRRDKLLHEHHKQMKYAQQVSKGSLRPQSSKPAGYAHYSSLSKGSSMASLNSDNTGDSTVSGGRRMRPSSGRSNPPPPRGPKQAWDERW